MTRSLSVSSRVSTLALAVALAAGPSPAAAQSFAGTGAFTNPAHGTIDNSVPNTTTVTVNQDQSVINWTPIDNGTGGGAINFQPQDTTAIFQNNPDLVGDFAVLNRINVADNSRAVALNGSIQGMVNGQTGGAIYFYSPSGFVVGATAVINVGSLVLSASPISFDQDTGIFIDTNDGSKVSFGLADNPNAQINTVDGSQIFALNEGSYVALVAPRVGHGGSISVNGGAALVGAEAATITFRTSGLFDIRVDAGTTDANGVGVNGDISGPASTGSGDNHRVYMVAVPKNDALTMAIGGGSNLGFDIAGAAEVIDNAVVLSAGHDIVSGDISSTPSAASGADAHMSIAEVNFTSAVYARADGIMSAGAVDETLTFASDASLRGRDMARLDAGSGGVVSVGGDLRLSANADGVATGEYSTAGDVTMQEFAGGQLTVTGTTVLTAVGTGGFSGTVGTPSGDGTGGVILVQSTTGGDMMLSGGLDADASGYGGSFFGAIDGGDGFGGTVNVFTSGGSTMDVTEAAYLRAHGRGGLPSDCSECGGVGGIGDAGTINVQAHTGPNNSMNFGDVLYMWADGVGGNGATGGLGIGGNVNFSSSSSSNVTVADDVSISATGIGGDGFVAGGMGRGGTVQAFVSGGTMTLGAQLAQSVSGYGGHSSLGVGGNGRGGSGQAFANSAGTFTVAGPAIIDTSGYGGSGATGGNGQGGLPGSGGGSWYSASTGGTLQISSVAYLVSNGQGGYSDVGIGGIGQGGHVEAYANNATLGFGNDLIFNADGAGGSTGGAGSTTGAGNGGEVFLQALLGGNLTIGRNMEATAAGVGGAPNFGTYSGNGTGGEINVNARDGNSVLDITGSATLEVDGYAGYSTECSFGCSAGGIGQGGDIFIGTSGSISTGINRLEIGSTLEASANGWGGESAVIDPDTNTTINGGEGIGGRIFLFANGGNSVNVGQETDLIAIGWGGYDSANLVAGNGQGGQVFLTSDTTAGNVLNFDSAVHLDVSGHGGDSGQVANGDGGDGTGGTASVAVRSGAMTVNGELSVFSMGFGGNSFGGVGGDGTGNTARINAAGGDLTVNGTAYADASGEGGTGTTGGNGTGGGNFELNVGGAHIFAKNGDLVINGSAVAVSDGTGGDGSFGGGDGGNGTGGWASLHSANGDLVSSSVTVQGVESSAFVSASGTGGDGGEGLTGSGGSSGSVGGDGATGGSGGNGGIGSGGRAAITAAAGNGTMNVGIAVTQATGTGGLGGLGGNGGAGGIGTVGQGGNGGTGGVGGTGGAAFGGIINVGTESGAAEAVAINNGVGNYGSVEMDSSAEGGMGGDGGLGGAAGSGTPAGLAGAAGNGGNGGDAEGGIATLLVRGSTVNITFADLVADATGGDGGFGAVRGAGGNAESDEIGVLVNSRNINVAQGGTLNAGTIVGTSTSLGGAGTGPGASMMEGGSGFVIENSVATIGSLDFTITADNQIADLATDSIAIVNGQVTITGAFSFVTDGVASILADDGTPLTTSLSADSFSVTADNFIHDPERAVAADFGTISANSFDFATNDDLIIDANLVSASAIDLVAPGLIDTGNLAATDFVNLHAGGSVDTGNINAGGNITVVADTGGITGGSMDSGGAILLDGATGVSTGVLGNLTAAGNIQVLSGGSILTGIATSNGGNIHMDGDGSVSVESVNAFGSATLLAATSFNTGNINAGGPVTVLAQAGTMDIGNMVAGGNVSLTAGDSILGEDISTTGSITASTGTGFLKLEILQSGGAVDLTSGGALSTLDVTAATFIDANAALSITMGALSGQPITLTAGGGIQTGAIDSSQFVRLTAGGNILTGAINALGFIEMATTGGSIETDDLDSDEYIDLLAATGIDLGSAVSGEYFDIETLAGDISTGDVTSGDAIEVLTGNGDVDLGNLSAGIVNPIVGGEYHIAAVATGGSVTVASATALSDIAMAASGNIVSGDIDAGGRFLGLAGGNMTFDAITSGPQGRIHLGDYSMIALGGDLGENYDIEAVFNADPVQTGGSISFNGPVSTNLLLAAAGGLATINDSVSAQFMELTSDDIAIGTTGSIDAPGVILVSSNATRTIIGDGVAGQGYLLSNAEFGRINADGLIIGADAALGAAPSMLIGDLDGQAGSFEFATYSGDEEDNPVGTIRVVGEALFTGMSDADEVSFITRTFELDAATALLSLTGNGTALAGTLELDANHIHVASGDILDQLALDPQYDGYQDDLNAPADAQRPGGVIRAGIINIEIGNAGTEELYTLFVQNTGTSETPAGFVATDQILFGEDDEFTLPPGSLDVVINGQIITPTGTLTGIDVRDALVESQGGDLTPFTENSTVNGCLLVGECAPPPPPLPPGGPNFQPSPGIQQEIVLAKDNILPPPEFGNEDFIDDNDEETDEGSRSPIQPPDPLFDTSELGEEASAGDPEVGTSMRSSPGLTEPGDVDDPVSGSGNPGLMEEPAGPPSNEEKQQ